MMRLSREISSGYGAAPFGRHNARGGFTLVELAIVLLIVGLIVGGVLRGRELIASAEINATQTTLNNFRTATNTFRDKYVALPGDMEKPKLIDPDVLSASDGGDDNGDIGTASTSSTKILGKGTEAELVFAHLGAAGLLPAVDPESILKGGLDADNGLTAPTGGFITLKYDTIGLGYSRTDTDHWILVGSMNGPSWCQDAEDNDCPTVSPQDLASLDRKTDDGAPATGSVRGGSGGCVNGQGRDATYKASSDTVCIPVVRF